MTGPFGFSDDESASRASFFRHPSGMHGMIVACLVVQAAGYLLMPCPGREMG